MAQPAVQAQGFHFGRHDFTSFAASFDEAVALASVAFAEKPAMNVYVVAGELDGDVFVAFDDSPTIKLSQAQPARVRQSAEAAA